MTSRSRTLRSVAFALLAALAAVAFVGCSSPSGGSVSGQRPGMGAAQVIAPGDSLVIPVADISETARFYPVEVDGVVMEVVAVKAPDGTIRTAFNTCEICYDSGAGYYTQQGSDLVCTNCGNRFAMSQVEIEAGGCNPWPIFAEDKVVTDESITIGYEFLQASERIFSNWVS